METKHTPGPWRVVNYQDKHDVPRVVSDKGGIAVLCINRYLGETGPSKQELRENEMELTTTLNRIREHSPCTDGWKKLNKYLGSEYGEGTPINLLTILDSNGVQDMLWCMRATVEDSNPVSSQLAIAFAEEVLPIFESRYPADSRPRKAIQAAKDYADGKISIEEVRAAAVAAADAAAAYAAAYAAAFAVAVAADAAAAAAYAAAAAADVAAASREKARQRQADIIRVILQ